jgi:hypothetical protein
VRKREINSALKAISKVQKRRFPKVPSKSSIDLLFHHGTLSTVFVAHLQQQHGNIGWIQHAEDEVPCHDASRVVAFPSWPHSGCRIVGGKEA